MALYSEEPRRRVALANRIRASAEAALALDAREDGAHHVLARWHLELALLNPVLRLLVRHVLRGDVNASVDTALAHYAMAAELAPGRLVHHAELGKALLRVGRRREVRLQVFVLASNSVDHPGTGIFAPGIRMRQRRRQRRECAQPVRCMASPRLMTPAQCRVCTSRSCSRNCGAKSGECSAKSYELRRESGVRRGGQSCACSVHSANRSHLAQLQQLQGRMLPR
jgi:hypothetical protein